ncbi:MAG TPA: DUF4124 domain-containing protein [Oceanospirillales bacterium]|nr:DUF4124 domain-containing protein [Oceanospirillales bacterium]
MMAVDSHIDFIQPPLCSVPVYLLMTTLLLCTCFPLCAAEKFYKWTDANGNIHYTDKKPENQNSAVVKVKDLPTQPQSHNINQPSDAEGSEKKTTQEKLDEYAKQNKKARNKAHIKKQRCREAKQQLQKYKASISYRKKEPLSGGYIYLTEDKKAKQKARNNRRIKQYQKHIKKSCN